MDFLTCIIIIISLIIWLCTLMLFPSKSNRGLPPGPRPLPVIGNILQLGPKPHRALADLARLHGPVMSLKLGTVTTVVISSPAAAKEVLQKHDHLLSGRPFPDAARALDHFKHSLVWRSTSSPNWKTLKRLCSVEMFSLQKLVSTETLRRQKLDELLQYLDQCSVQGRPVYIGQAVFTTVLNIISNTLFSIDLARYDECFSRKFKDIVWDLVKIAAMPNISDLFPALGFLDLQGIRRRTGLLFGEFFQLFDGIILDRISRRRTTQPSSKTKDVLDSLLDLKDKSELTREDIYSLLMELIITGVETTTGAIEWLMAELLKNPEKMVKARSELDRILKPGSLMQESDIPNLPYLDAVIKETFRMHAGFLIPHKAEAEVDVCGFKLPKDTRVLVNVWAICQNETLWPNPSRFEPERFLNRKCEDRDQFDFLPFGAGRRMCPGIPMAWRTVPFLLGSLLHSFEWKLVNGETPQSLDMDDKFGITVEMAKPLIALPIKL